jgi:hypothetical protein
MQVDFNSGHLADALTQSNWQEQFGLSALFNGTLTDSSLSRLTDSNKRPVVCALPFNENVMSNSEQEKEYHW